MVGSQSRCVGRATEEDGLRWGAVSSGTPRLLKVGFKGVGHVGMQHEAHVGLVYTHAEGIGGHHHTTLTSHPKPLTAVALGGVKSRMKVFGGNAVLDKQGGKLLGIATAAGVDDATTLGGGRHGDNAAVLVLVAHHAVTQIGTHEAAAKKLAVVHGKMQADIFDHLGSGGGGESYEGRRGMVGADFGNLQIGRTEVVAPLRDTVGLVDSNQAHLHLAEVLYEATAAQPFRRNIEELDVAVETVVENGGDVVVTHARSDAGSLDMARMELHDLVFHQRYQRRHHKTKPLHHQRG